MKMKMKMKRKKLFHSFDVLVYLKASRFGSFKQDSKGKNTPHLLLISAR